MCVCVCVGEREQLLVSGTGEVLLVDWACSRQEASKSSKVTNSKRGYYQPGEMMHGYGESRPSSASSSYSAA